MIMTADGEVGKYLEETAIVQDGLPDTPHIAAAGTTHLNIHHTEEAVVVAIGESVHYLHIVAPLGEVTLTARDLTPDRVL